MKFIQYIRWLSLGIPTGAICVLLLVADKMAIIIPVPVYPALFAAVWFIYLFDHWWDIRRISPKTERRKFHDQYKPLLVLLMTLCVIIGVLALIKLYPPGLRAVVITRGLLLSLACGIYLFASQWLGKQWLKEICVASNYALGIMLIPLTLGAGPTLWLITLQIFLLALVNLLTFSVFEEEEDRAEGFHSIATQLGTKTCATISGLVLLVLWCSLLWVQLPFAIEVFMALGGLTYATMYAFPDFFATKERFRIFGDALFLMAALFLLF